MTKRPLSSAGGRSEPFSECLLRSFDSVVFWKMSLSECMAESRHCAMPPARSSS